MLRVLLVILLLAPMAGAEPGHRFEGDSALCLPGTIISNCDDSEGSPDDPYIIHGFAPTEPVEACADPDPFTGEQVTFFAVCGITLVAEIRSDVLAQHAWEAQAMPGATVCGLDNGGQAFESTRGPAITCQLGAIAASNSILVGGGLWAGLIFAGGLGIAIFASVRLETPLQGIRQTVQRIQTGDLSARADESGPQDMRILARDVNQMAEKLSNDRLALEEFNENLRDMVHARTQELELAKEAQAQFFYGLSHDFKAPLRSVNGFTGLLDRAVQRGDLDDAADLVAKVRSSDAMTTLVTQLLDFANAEKHVVERGTTDLNNLLMQIRDETMAGTTVKLHVQSIRRARIDEDIVGRIVRNLVSNAVDHGRPDGQIHVHARRKGGRLQITVRDDGDGVPAAMQAELFKPFVRGKASGSGLGLAIVERLAHAHGGDVTVRNDDGAVFTVTLSE